MNTTAPRKVIITGTGRAGTTFLVRLLTELGLDTGYTPETWQRDYFAHSQAGLEHDLAAENTPYIVKNPQLCETLAGILAGQHVVIDHALIPIRDIEAAALSRARIGGAHGNVPGGLWHTADPKNQKAVLAEMFHRLMHTLAEHNIPHTLLAFPRFVQDADYCYEKLGFLLKQIDRPTFHAVFARIADPKQVHDFSGQTAPAAAVGTDFLRAQQRRRWRRRVVRFAGASAVAAALAFGILAPRAETPAARPTSSTVSDSLLMTSRYTPFADERLLMNGLPTRLDLRPPRLGAYPLLTTASPRRATLRPVRLGAIPEAPRLTIFSSAGAPEAPPIISQFYPRPIKRPQQ